MSVLRVNVGGARRREVTHRPRCSNACDARRSTHNWAIQLSGVKRFVFCEPGALSGATGNEFDAFDQNLDATRFETATGRCFRVLLEPGDLIYWPSRWWHQTQNGEMEPREGPETAAPVLSVGVSGMVVDVRKRAEFARLVKRRGAPPETADCLPR